MSRWTELTEALSQLPVFEQVNAVKQQLDSIRPLSQEVEGRVMQKLRLDWNYNSNAIEGNKLTRGETYTFLMQGLTAKAKPFKDHQDIKGHNKAIDFLFDLVKDQRDLTEGDIRDLHKIILVEPYKNPAITPDGQETTRLIQLGKYKTQPNFPKTATGEIHYYAMPEDTPIFMQELVDWYNEARKNPKIHPSVLAAFVHHRFVEIHPFDDGNGRLGRMLMNLILIKRGFPPAIIKQEKRDEYYSVLSQADKKEYQPLVELIAETVLASMNLYLKAARGENIEDVSDLDKEIALFKGSLKKTHMKRNDELIKKVLINVCKPLTDSFKLGLDELFKELREHFKFSGITLKKQYASPTMFPQTENDYFTDFSYSDYGVNEFLENMNSYIGSRDFIRFVFILEDLAQISDGNRINLDFQVRIDISFGDELKYKILINEGTPSHITLLEKHYDEELWNEELSKASDAFKKYAFGVLKKKIQEANKK